MVIVHAQVFSVFIAPRLQALAYRQLVPMMSPLLWTMEIVQACCWVQLGDGDTMEIALSLAATAIRHALQEGLPAG